MRSQSGKMNMSSKSNNSVSTTHGRHVTERPRYEKPRIMSYSEEEILQDIGPAQGYGRRWDFPPGAGRRPH